MKKTANVLAGIASLAFLALPVQATTIHVPDDQPTIQAGIDAASYGDTVLVECGTYYEDLIEMKSSITLRSATGQADCVIIDDQNWHRVMQCVNVTSDTRIEGFTFTNAADTGVFCSNSSPTFANMRFSNNWCQAYGGGMYCAYGSCPALENCVFSGNVAYSGGGGLACRTNSHPILTDVTFTGNLGGDGGGLYCDASSPTLTGVTFAGNDVMWPESRGGAICCRNSSSPSLSHATLTDNRAWTGGGMYCAGGSNATLMNAALAGNYAYSGGDGGAVYCDGSSLSLANTIIVESGGGETVFCVGGSVTLACCDVYGNEGGDWGGCIADQYGVNGNVSEDPMFCGDLNPDEPYTLHVNSPCAPENNPECGLIGAWGVACGLTPVEETSWGAIKAMFR